MCKMEPRNVLWVLGSSWGGERGGGGGG